MHLPQPTGTYLTYLRTRATDIIIIRVWYRGVVHSGRSILFFSFFLLLGNATRRRRRRRHVTLYARSSFILIPCTIHFFFFLTRSSRGN